MNEMSILTKIEFKLPEFEKLIELAQSGDKKALISKLKQKLPRGYKEYKKDKYRPILNSIKAKSEEFRDKLIAKTTKAETVFKAYLKAIGIDYKYQHIFWYNRNGGLDFYIMDFYLPKYNMCIEVDGGYHDDDKQNKLDWERTKTMQANGITKVLRFSNAQVLMEQELVLKELSNIK